MPSRSQPGAEGSALQSPVPDASGRAVEELLSRIVSIAADAIISVDEAQRITMFNHGAEKIFGYMAAEIIGEPLEILLPEAFHAAHRHHIEAFATGEADARRMGERREIFGRRRDGTSFPADASISRVRVGEGWVFTAVLRDVTDQQRAAEEKTRLLAEAQRAVSLRDEVLAIVSHDLRNPLSAISLCCAGLISNPPDKPEDIVEIGETIRESANWMHRLISDLLDVASIEAGRLSVEPTPIDPVILVVKAIGLFEGPAADRKIALDLDVPEFLPTVVADEERALQIIANLMANAIKFTSPGGSVRLGAAAANEEVVFSIADTGPGIPAEHLPHIFERFWQIRRGARIRGTGLGLAIAKGIVDAHSGRIWVESTVGVGSTFSFTLPLSPATA